MKPIARGRTAEIFAGEPGRVVKVYLPGFSARDADYEARIAAAVQQAGVACPRFFGRIEVGGRPGLVYERIDAVTMAEQVLKAPWRILALARRMAALHWQMHQARMAAGTLPSQRQKYTGRIEISALLPPALRSRLLEAYAALPEESRLCHGDLHPGNVLSTRTQDLAIDWIDASVGHPLADVARTTILLTGMAATLPLPPLRWMVRRFHDHYLRAYFEHGGDRATYRAFLPIVAAARLAEGIPELQDWLLRQAEV